MKFTAIIADPVRVGIRNQLLVKVSDAKGLGVEVNEEMIRRQSVKFWDAPHLRRRDGSVTNW